MQIVGPSLAGIGTRAAAILTNPEYHGTAKSAGRVHPRVDPASERIRRARARRSRPAGQSIMPAIYQDMLKPEDIDHLVAYLATLK